MTERQQAILEREFKVNEHFTIRRSDYENLPCPMLAWTWTDSRMKELAGNISRSLAPYDENDPEGIEDDFWKTMEDEAVKMNMTYYEDLDDDERASLEYEWMNLK